MSNVSTIQSHLELHFREQRVVFWHDPKGEYSDELDDLTLDGVEVLRVANNEYAIKHRLLHVQPQQKFLVYRPAVPSTDIENWLLDLELAYGVFSADRGSLISQELGLTADAIEDVVTAHEKFFNSTQRVRSLKALLTPQDDARRLQAKMCAVVLRQREHSLQEITRSLLMENADGGRAKYDALVDFGLDGFFWRGVDSIYHYSSVSPSVDDFILWLFRKATTGFRSDQPELLRNIELDFASFRNDFRSRAQLAQLAQRVARDLDYATSIESLTFRELIDDDLFEQTDQRIIVDLARAVLDKTVSAREVAEVVRTRQKSPWIDSYAGLYAAIEAAAELLAAIDSLDLTMTSFDDGLQRYCGQWYKIDQLYRQFTHARRTADRGEGPLSDLQERVEKHYTNKYVYELGSAWQQQVDAAPRWQSLLLRSQRLFFEHYIQRLLSDEKKAVVIVSDALRYEVADELRSRIRCEDRFDAELEPALGVLPSYTQLGMAALLPHSVLTHSADGKTVLADGEPTNGTANRARVLQSVSGTAIQAEDFRALNQADRRELFKNNRVLYVYHDVIDATGDKPGTERSVFEAADRAMAELVDLVKKATNANATNIFITADHGFLFQDEALPDQSFLSEKPQGDEILVANRRYVLGHGLKPEAAFTTFQAAQLGLDGDLEVQIPKSIQRLKLPGGGSRYVHGGATLQEVVVPVLTVNKKRKSDTRPVDVQVIPETDKITTGQLMVKLFQADPVTDKVQPRTVRIGLYVGETLISNDPPPERVFDSTSTDKRDRYQAVQLLLNQDSASYNNRAVELRIEERIPNTTHWRVYRKAVYTLKRSFTSDFDF